VQCTDVHSKTADELVQATDHASEMEYQFIHLYCNQWCTARGSNEPIFICCLPWWILEPAGLRVGRTVGNMAVNHLMFADEICVFGPS